MKISKRDFKYYGTIAALLILIILTDIFKEKPLDWTFYLERNSKDPYGTWVMYRALPDLFPDREVNEQTIYQSLKDNLYQSDNFIFISSEFAPQETDTEALLNLAENGNHVFISAYIFKGPLADSLNAETAFHWKAAEDSFKLRYTVQALKDSVFWFGEKFEQHYFSRIDTANAEVLALSAEQDVSFIRQAYGEGFIYLHSQPDIFTNYAFITQKKFGAAYAALSHLPYKNVVWDEYYKPYKEQQYSPLRYVFRNEALRYAWYVLLASLMLHMIFTAKRTQRIIPVKETLRNTTADFIETLGSLYYSQKNHRRIALNRILYFKDEISRDYYLSGDEITPENIAFLSEKTGSPAKFWEEFFAIGETIQSASQINAGHLTRLNTILESFNKYRKQ